MHQLTYEGPLKSEKDLNAKTTGDDFPIIVLHELRTPTAAILGWAELLSKTPLEDEKVAHGIEIIKRNAQLQSQLIDHLIDFARISTDHFKLNLQKIAILPTLKAAIETMMPLALAKDIKITEQLDSVAGWIIGDSFRLQQVFTNLLSNAIRFTPSSGHIRVLLAEFGPSIEGKVRDTGSGISAESLPDIFNRFRRVNNRTTEPGGLGLGLNISQRLIESHGGRIDAFSNGQGQGATFTVHLPRADVSLE